MEVLRIVLIVLLILAMLGVFLPASFGFAASGVVLVVAFATLCQLMRWV